MRLIYFKDNILLFGVYFFLIIIFPRILLLPLLRIYADHVTYRLASCCFFAGAVCCVWLLSCFDLEVWYFEGFQMPLLHIVNRNLWMPQYPFVSGAAMARLGKPILLHRWQEHRHFTGRHGGVWWCNLILLVFLKEEKGFEGGSSPKYLFSNISF